MYYVILRVFYISISLNYQKTLFSLELGITDTNLLSITVIRSPRRDMQRKKLSRAHEIASHYHEMLSRGNEMLPSWCARDKNFFCMSLRGLRTVITT